MLLFFFLCVFCVCFLCCFLCVLFVLFCVVLFVLFCSVCWRRPRDAFRVDSFKPRWRFC